MVETRFRPLLDQSGGRRIPPATLEHEGVPHFDLLGIRLATVFKTPFKDFFVRAALQGAGRQRVKIHVQEAAHTVIERATARNQSQMITGWQTAFPGIETNLVQDAAEEDNATDLIARRADWERHGRNNRLGEVEAVNEKKKAKTHWGDEAALKPPARDGSVCDDAADHMGDHLPQAVAGGGAALQLLLRRTEPHCGAER